MIDPLLLISGLIFFGVLIVGWAVYAFMQSQQRANDWSVRAKGESLTQKSLKKKEQEQSGIKEYGLKLLEKIGQVNKSKDQASHSQLRASLITAGYRKSQAPVIFMGTRIFLAVMFGLTFLIFGSDAVKEKDPKWFPIFLIGSMFVGYYGPQMWLRNTIAKRKELLVNGFPDALDLMVVCVEAGLGLDQAIARVGNEVKQGHPDLGDEFILLNLELRAGLSREQALRNLVNRTDLEDIRSLVALLIQTDRFGTSIGQALRVHSDSMRMKRRMKAEEKGAQLPVKLMIPLILFIFPALMVVIVGPGVINLIRNLLPSMGGGS
ncbi:MAG: type II secretion system F family protein [Nitrospira sp.]|nr:type II secretion system F family protein [Nitrospira sp.]MCB9710493.1 type II secretion system F family protein [Nitrospiraceae bacterium]MDR4487405.1 type II secretion system F family protein [Nitrospirales bacterium]MCA9464535.1 type II secretion system F family protein [Nitrospira sp.]MCA9474778.1 type II secretion system F family protein [Nitrospira sp.]